MVQRPFPHLFGLGTGAVKHLQQCIPSSRSPPPSEQTSHSCLSWFLLFLPFRTSFPCYQPKESLPQPTKLHQNPPPRELEKASPSYSLFTSIPFRLPFPGVVPKCLLCWNQAPQGQALPTPCGAEHSRQHRSPPALPQAVPSSPRTEWAQFNHRAGQRFILPRLCKQAGDEIKYRCSWGPDMWGKSMEPGPLLPGSEFQFHFHITWSCTEPAFLCLW